MLTGEDHWQVQVALVPVGLQIRGRAERPARQVDLQGVKSPHVWHTAKVPATARRRGPAQSTGSRLPHPDARPVATDAWAWAPRPAGPVIHEHAGLGVTVLPRAAHGHSAANSAAAMKNLNPLETIPRMYRGLARWVERQRAAHLPWHP